MTSFIRVSQWSRLVELVISGNSITKGSDLQSYRKITSIVLEICHSIQADDVHNED